MCETDLLDRVVWRRRDHERLPREAAEAGDGAAVAVAHLAQQAALLQR